MDHSNCGHGCSGSLIRQALAGCVDEAPELPPLRAGGATPEGDEVREECGEIITSVCQLKDIIDSADDVDKSLAPSKYLYVMMAVADLTKALVTYLEPEDGGEPY